MMTRRSIWLNGKNFLMMNVLGNLNKRLWHFNLKLNNLIEFSLGLPKYLLLSRRARFEMLLNLKTRKKSFNTMKIVLSFSLEVMYVCSVQAHAAVIREHEFFFPNNQKRIK